MQEKVYQGESRPILHVLMIPCIFRLMLCSILGDQNTDGLALTVLVEDDISIVFDETALCKGAIQCTEGVLRFIMSMYAEPL
jgi:hypothetical protein